jgi:ABC-2 type transport system permease protein/oleandomycin transport system permease protein
MAVGKMLYYQSVDTWAITKRNLLRYVRLPQLIFFSSIQPIIFLTLFNFVFGGALGKSGAVVHGKYIDYLLPGIMIQVTIFGGMQSAIGLATDMTSGVISRFRSLPMSRGAVLAGRTLADTIRNIIVIAIMIAYGYVLGFRFSFGFWEAVSMIAIVVLFGFAFSWVFAYVGMKTKDAEAAQLSGFVFIFPLIFASAAFVPVATMPNWLQHFANNQPITFAVNAARHFALGMPMDGALWKLLIWIFGILLVFIPLAVSTYRKHA